MKIIYPGSRRFTHNAGVDVVFESSGNAAGVGSSLLLAAKGGTVVLLGIPYGDVALPRLNFEKIVRNELKVIGSWNSISAPFPGKRVADLHSLPQYRAEISGANDLKLIPYNFSNSVEES